MWAQPTRALLRPTTTSSSPGTDSGESSSAATPLLQAPEKDADEAGPALEVFFVVWSVQGFDEEAV